MFAWGCLRVHGGRGEGGIGALRALHCTVRAWVGAGSVVGAGWGLGVEVGAGLAGAVAVVHIIPWDVLCAALPAPPPTSNSRRLLRPPTSTSSSLLGLCPLVGPPRRPPARSRSPTSVCPPS